MTERRHPDLVHFVETTRECKIARVLGESRSGLNLSLEDGQKVEALRQTGPVKSVMCYHLPNECQNLQ